LQNADALRTEAELLKTLFAQKHFSLSPLFAHSAQLPWFCFSSPPSMQPLQIHNFMDAETNAVLMLKV